MMNNTFVCSYSEPIVSTREGKIRGYKYAGIYHFLGIQYATAKRFKEPVRVSRWDGVRDALSYGHICPQTEGIDIIPGREIMIPRRFWPMDEDCLNLNIWTPSLERDDKLPVIIWLHGGGFQAGSSIDQIAYDGRNLSSYGNAVIVSVNHRLNILGYFDLSSYGRDYQFSGNAGTMDIVTALEWVQDNIINFGGNPDNVLLAGQSGGGGKVVTLLNTPSAVGLFHKGVIMSGIASFMHNPIKDYKIVSDAILKELGKPNGGVEFLQSVPIFALFDAFKRVIDYLKREGAFVQWAPLECDGYFKGNPLEVGFIEQNKNIPLVIGSVLCEMNFGPGIAKRKELSDEENYKILYDAYGENTEALMKEFLRIYPDKYATDLLTLDRYSRGEIKTFCKARAALKKGKVFNYIFSCDFEKDDTKPAWHCSDIPFVFHNVKDIPILNVEGVTEQLETQISSSFINFANTGDPSIPNLPDWKACTEDMVNTMIFDRRCRLATNHDDRLYELFGDYCKSSDFFKMKA